MKSQSLAFSLGMTSFGLSRIRSYVSLGVVIKFLFLYAAGGCAIADESLKERAAYLYDALELSVYETKVADEFSSRVIPKLLTFAQRMSKGTTEDERFLSCVSKEANSLSVKRIFRAQALAYLEKQKEIEFYISFVQRDDVRSSLIKAREVMLAQISRHASDDFLDQNQWFLNVDFFVEATSSFQKTNPRSKEHESLSRIEDFFALTSDAVFFGKQDLRSTLFSLCK